VNIGCIRGHYVDYTEESVSQSVGRPRVSVNYCSAGEWIVWLSLTAHLISWCYSCWNAYQHSIPIIARLMHAFYNEMISIECWLVAVLLYSYLHVTCSLMYFCSTPISSIVPQCLVLGYLCEWLYSMPQQQFSSIIIIIIIIFITYSAFHCYRINLHFEFYKFSMLLLFTFVFIILLL